MRESEWRDALRAVLDAVVECASCGRQNMTEPGENPPPRDCWGCEARLVLPPRLTVTTPPPPHRAPHPAAPRRPGAGPPSAAGAGPARLLGRGTRRGTGRTPQQAGEVRARQPLAGDLDGHPLGRHRAEDRARSDGPAAVGAGPGPRRRGPGGGAGAVTSGA
ncbi:hypothetical protein LT493_39520 [Streptomyces tricolor]|nr:hypothetical protein [Streptomyces tricolor]